jgi:rare lipoprotein A
MKNLFCLVSVVCVATAAVSAQERPPGQAAQTKRKAVQYGMASYYANKFQGRPTASGEPYDKEKMTCAHNALPMGTWLKVTSLRNKRFVIVKVTDRLNHRNKRLVDLSRAAASKLGFLKRGVARVKVELANKNSIPE